MILHQGLLKKVIFAGAVALAYLQGASCIVEDKSVFLEGIHGYWISKVAFIESQIQIQSAFLEKAGLIKSRETALDFDSCGDLEKGKSIMSEITKYFLHLSKEWEEMAEFEETLNRLNTFIQRRQMDSGRIEASEDTTEFGINLVDKKNVISKLESLLPKMLNDSNLILEKMKTFNLHMLRFIKNHSNKKYGEHAQIHELGIFKLAMKNKLFATNVIFTFFEAEPLEPAFSSEDGEKKLRHLFKYLAEFTPNSDNIFIDYKNAIMNDIRENKTSPLVSANAHFPLFLQEHGLITEADSTVVDTYFNLLKENLPDVCTDQLSCITPEKVIRVILIEYLMNGCLINSKKNQLFSNLKKTIEKIERVAQDNILDALCMLWKDWYCDYRRQSLSLEGFCKESRLNTDSLKSLQNILIDSKWMYMIEQHNLNIPVLSLREEIAREMHFDMSYLHPMWYMCRRYERITHLNEPDFSCSEKPFMETEGSNIIIRSYKISKRDDDLIRVENMRDFIGTCFSEDSNAIVVLRRHQDNIQYYALIDNYFLECFRMIPLRGIITFTKEVREEEANNFPPPFKRARLA
ncbi:hypothetical protein NEMIN01_1152 [Nematocida minor]|uniref:uncharacterized protein n=1 Tax=Nematocida minor TaxID=1912983 RepID=UPI002220324B|nr:uncharacterized protein NEMIN01_1152 [Nematocida minor]KAI5190687.1 hypothetical protein NEMIN01_1152 [Nematocida minor]